MKLDVKALQFLGQDDFRVLTAIEMGMRNHEMVPIELVARIARLRLGGLHKAIATLHRLKLVHHESKFFDGYRLTNLGYDYLALRAMSARDNVAGVGSQIGVGKESDIFKVVNNEERELCLKLHRLGRTSFRAIKNKRDYHRHRTSPSWLYLSRLAATKEFSFMKVLRENGFPVPEPIDSSRHAVVMSLVDGFPLNHVQKIDQPEVVANEMIDLVCRFAKHGLIHGDFNEFNIMISSAGQLTVIDFPQMVSVNHPNARMYFERDINCVRRFFRKRFDILIEAKPNFEELVANVEKRLDVQVSASGFSNKMAKELDEWMDMDEEDEEHEEEESAKNQNKDPQVEEALEEEIGTATGEQAEKDPQVVDDSPQAYLAFDFDTSAAVASASVKGPKSDTCFSSRPSLDDVRRRVRRDLSKRGRGKGKGGKSSRNVVKKKETHCTRCENN